MQVLTATYVSPNRRSLRSAGLHAPLMHGICAETNSVVATPGQYNVDDPIPMLTATKGTRCGYAKEGKGFEDTHCARRGNRHLRETMVSINPTVHVFVYCNKNTTHAVRAIWPAEVRDSPGVYYCGRWKIVAEESGRFLLEKEA